MHNLIGYIGTTDDHLASSTALHSDSPTTSTATSSKADQTAKQEFEEEGSGSSQGDSETAGGEEEGGEREGGAREGKEGEEEGEGEILEYELSPEILKVEVEKWRSSLNYAIDSQDTQTTEKVCQYCCMCVVVFCIRCQDCMKVKSKFGSSVIAISEKLHQQKCWPGHLTKGSLYLQSRKRFSYIQAILLYVNVHAMSCLGIIHYLHLQNFNSHTHSYRYLNCTHPWFSGWLSYC